VEVLSGKKIGLLASLLCVLLAAYEFIAIATPLPTISRVVQGFGGGVRVGVGVVVAGVLVVFAGWVFKHFGFDERSDL
jgi:MFS family permease